MSGGAKRQTRKHKHLPIRTWPVRSSLEKMREFMGENEREMYESVMVMAILLATMVFQAVTRPPRDFAQEDLETRKHYTAYTVGTTIMAIKHPDEYKYFITCNTALFITSLTVILIRISGVSLKW